MDELDRRIIGYEPEKETLRQIIHILKHTELYREKGASLPRGLLLSGVPGTGKSTMAEAVIAESGRKSFVIRKEGESDIFEVIKQTFEKAKEVAPSIVLLEDMDKFSSEESRHSSEWAALQTAIDESKDSDVFVIATANSTDYIAQSLLRAGRFDYIINVPVPRGITAERIMKHYLEGAMIGEDVVISDISKALNKKSCATLETVMKVAKTSSIYEACDKIYKRHLVDAILQIVHNIGKTSNTKIDEKMRDYVAWHEAAHAMVAEILLPGRLAMVTIRRAENGQEGFADYCEKTLYGKQDVLNKAAISLAGKVATEQLLFVGTDLGAADDIQNALREITNFVIAGGGCGIENCRYFDDAKSEAHYQKTEIVVAALMEQVYQRVSEIIGENTELLKLIHDELLEKQTLLNSDIKRLFEMVKRK